MKILNLYAGIGGNRKLWGPEHEITSVEIDKETADIYANAFPGDTLVIADAHQYLIDHHSEFDFIWSSPPCPTHSRARFWGWSKKRPVYPDMSLYQEILFLKHHCKGNYKWVVENVKPYYKVLIEAIELGRHLIWANFDIPYIEHKSSDIRKLSGTSKRDKRIRNMVDPEIGLHILNCATGSKTNMKQMPLFVDGMIDTETKL
jgi:DNA (cytosine-5)-methyltransferase 1